MKQNDWGRISLFMGLFQIFCGALLVMSMSGQKDTWNYYLSSSHRSDVDTGSMIGWLIIFAGVVELIYGIIVKLAGEQAWSSDVYEDATAEDDEWIVGEIVKKEWDPAQHQLEWYTVKKKDGSTTEIWKHISNPVVLKVGDCGWIRVVEGQAAEFFSSDQEE